MWHRNLIIISVLLLLQSSFSELKSQCPVSTLNLNNQAEVDQFPLDFPNCTELNVELRLVGTDVTNLDGLSNLEALNGGALIMDNSLLPNFTGLNNVEHIAGISILSNPSIVNFEGLNQLNNISGGLQIEFNVGLQNFNGLELLDSIAGQLFIYNNSNLSDISSLQNLEYIGGNLVINISPLLSFCSVEGICDYILNPNGNVLLAANGTGCNTVQEIEDNCVFCDLENIWQGPVGGSWHNQSHWSLSEIPTDCHNVIVPAGSNLKVLSGMTAEAFTLLVHDSAIFETESSAILNVVVE